MYKVVRNTLLLMLSVFLLSLAGRGVTAHAMDDIYGLIVPEAEEEYERILYVGDSRSVDCFSGEESAIEDEEMDGITVYVRDGAKFSYLKEAISDAGMGSFDTLVCWLGCNDNGDFSSYIPFYNKLLKKGKKIIVCTVGPTVDEWLTEDDPYWYPNEKIDAYNRSLRAWAKSKKVTVIDLHKYVSKHVEVDPDDGLHYVPKPTKKIWKHLLKKLRKYCDWDD